ncbi:MAG TPA: sugar ABC transporter permease [Acetobacteraceae bacterium]|nr:sugar ABC transporter permease [Acetobacteraceae bacterium]
MDATSTLLADRAPSRAAVRGRFRRGPQGSDLNWALAFLVPYVAVFLLFVLYPVGFALWLGHRPADYVQLFSDPIYLQTIVNTLIYVVLGVNLHLFGALLLSGFFMRRSWAVRSLLLVYILPWAIPAIPIFIAIHWMLNGEWGFLNNLLWDVFHINGPSWLNSHWLGLLSVVVSYVWKWMPFWTVIFLAGRMAIPQDVYEAAAMDGAVGIRRFVYVTFPMLANLYLICTLLSTIWTLGDFNTVYFVTGGGPAWTTEVLATLGIRDAFTMDDPQLGMAAVLTALPLLIPLVIVLMRKLSKSQVQL